VHGRAFFWRKEIPGAWVWKERVLASCLVEVYHLLNLLTTETRAFHVTVSFGQ